MKRVFAQSLAAWLDTPIPARRPLVLRGARQVGKTWLVRDLAQAHDLDLVELNFERNPGRAGLFESNDPRVILEDLALLVDRDLVPEKTLLFLDEIQAAGELLGRLRWFYEELPELAVVAAGSLLEFELASHEWSMPVGRVTFRTLGPMGFPEFALAHGEERLLDVLARWRPCAELSALAHEKATSLHARWMRVGGMPQAVAADADGAPATDVAQIQRDLVAGYRADFAKYSGRFARRILDEVLRALPRSLGTSFVYARVAHESGGVKAHQVKHALELLEQARLCDVVRHTSANGVPLAVESRSRSRKVVLLDVGLVHGLLGSTSASSAGAPLARFAPGPAQRGALVEQLVGQELRALAGDEVGSLHYWQRLGGRTGEIDYVVELGGEVVPIELKAGAAGTMKSLHQFMFDKDLPLAVRCDANPPSVMSVDVRTTQGDPVSYRLLGIPHYLVWNLPVLAASV